MRQRLQKAATQSTTQASVMPRPTAGFPHVPPQEVPRFVPPSTRTARKQMAANRVIMSQPSLIPIVPLRPAPASQGPAMTPSVAATDPSVAGTISSFDWHNTKSVEAVTKIVEEVLRNLGHDGFTLVGKYQKGRAYNTKRSRQTAIKTQQALITAEEDCWWKVRPRLADRLCN